MELFDDALLQSIGKSLIEKNETVAVAESVTSGAIQLAMSCIMEAGKFYQGGVTTYNLGQKYRHLDVEPISAMATDCVSREVAEQMALHVTQLFRSDWGIAITGYAVPVPQSGNEVFAWYAITYRGQVKESGKINPAMDDQVRLQLRYANQVCSHLLRQLSAS